MKKRRFAEKRLFLLHRQRFHARLTCNTFTLSRRPRSEAESARMRCPQPKEQSERHAHSQVELRLPAAAHSQ